MATKQRDIQTELAHFKNFEDRVNAFNHLDPYTIDRLARMGFIQVSSVMEHAVADTGNLEVVSIDGMDLSDRSDVKYSTVRLRQSGKAYSASVTGIRAKIGNLRVQVYERIMDQMYYFVIPHDEYCDVSYIEIPFDLDGTPKTLEYTNRPFQRWWKYQVDSFADMCLIDSWSDGYVPVYR